MSHSSHCQGNELTEPSAAAVIGACITVHPFSRAIRHTAAAFASIFVLSMHALTALCSLPFSVVNSFWNSIITSAMRSGSSARSPSPP